MTDQKNNLLLSICIPTRGRLEFLLPTLNSIFNAGANPSLFEVVVYDSAEDDLLQKHILQNYTQPNLRYKRGANNGFFNLISALKMGNGAFLKLHNDYSMFRDDSLQYLLNLIGKNVTQKPVIFLGNGTIKNLKVETSNSFDDFLNTITYQSTWSTAFGVWKQDLELILAKAVEINPMFPHTSLLYAHTYKSAFLIDNTPIFNNKDVLNKGGYNLFETFGVTYFKMLDGLLSSKSITRKTFRHIKDQMFKTFFINWYCDTMILKNQYTFDLSNTKQHVEAYYGSSGYYAIVFLAYLRAGLKKAKYILKEKQL